MATVDAMLVDLVPNDVDLLVLPEMSFTGIAVVIFNNKILGYRIYV